VAYVRDRVVSLIDVRNLKEAHHIDGTHPQASLVKFALGHKLVLARKLLCIHEAHHNVRYQALLVHIDERLQSHGRRKRCKASKNFWVSWLRQCSIRLFVYWLCRSGRVDIIWELVIFV
jgi:hypothetical protein